MSKNQKHKNFKFIDSILIKPDGKYKTIKASDENFQNTLTINTAPDMTVVELDFSALGNFAPVSKDVLLNNQLTASQKGVYAVLLACQAYHCNTIVYNNAAFCELFSDDPRTVRERLKDLETYGLIKSYTTMIYQGNKHITYELLPPSHWKLPETTTKAEEGVWLSEEEYEAQKAMLSSQQTSYNTPLDYEDVPF